MLDFIQVHGLLHLLGFDHEISEEAEDEMEKEEEVLLKSLGWKGKGLIQSAYDANTNENLHTENSDGSVCFYQITFFTLKDVSFGLDISSFSFLCCSILVSNEIILLRM